MSSGPVARWLETFVSSNMCRQYVQVFQEFGYNNLNEICSLNAPQLIKMGVIRSDMEKIMENVSVLKQTMNYNQPNYQSYSSSDQLQMPGEANNNTSISTKQQGKRASNKSNRANSDAKTKQHCSNASMSRSGLVGNSDGTIINNGRKTKSKTNKNKIQVENVFLDDNSQFGTKNIQSGGSLNGSNGTQMYFGNPNSNSLSANISNNDPARKLSNEVNTIINNNNSQVNTKYSCLPLNTSNTSVNYMTNSNFEYQQQHSQSYQYPQHFYRNQAQSPTVLLSPISNPSSTSSTSSCSSLSSTSSPSLTSNQFLTASSTQNIHYQQQQTLIPSANNNSMSTFTTSSYSNNYPNSNQLQQNKQQYFYNNSATVSTSNSNWNCLSNRQMPTNPIDNNNFSYSSSSSLAFKSNQSSFNSSNNSNLNNFQLMANSSSSSSSSTTPPSSNINTNEINDPTQTNNLNYNSAASNLNSSKSSPLDYLERLALLPECQVVDPKSILSDSNVLNNDSSNIVYNNNCIYNNNEFLNANGNLLPTQMQKQEADLNLNFKRNINDIPDLLSNNNKKACNSNSNSPISVKNAQLSNNNNNKKFQQQLSFLSESIETTSTSPSSSSSSTSCSSLSNLQVAPSIGGAVNNNLSANIIDACNFDFLDYLPELNSTTIDQTITTAILPDHNSTKLEQNNSNDTETSLDSLSIPSFNQHEQYKKQDYIQQLDQSSLLSFQLDELNEFTTQSLDNTSLSFIQNNTNTSTNYSMNKNSHVFSNRESNGTNR